MIMTDTRVQKLAEVLVNYSTKVKPGDWVHIDSHLLAAPLAKVIAASVLAAGGHFSVSLADDDFRELLLKSGSEAQLSWVHPLDLHAIRHADVMIFLNAPENTRVFTGVDPARQQLWVQSYREWHDVYMKRSASGELRWVMANFPCPALAQEADMSLKEYEEFVYRATFVDQQDPVAAWQRVHDEQQRLIEWLAGKQTITIRGPHVDLSLSIDGRRFLNSDGDQNMPSGEIFTSPVEDSAQGWVVFTYPAVHMGREVQDVRFELEQGKVVKASAAKNEEFLLSMLAADEGASRLGELGIGTNYGIQRFTRDILFDEKIGGSFHLAVGSGFPEAGGSNESGIHWDFISDASQETEMRADGELFYQNGKFIV
jgi:aminopeptidase